MKKETSFKIAYQTFSILVICFAIAFFAIAQWTEPGSPPPTGNVATPLNVSNVGQEKWGGLGLNVGSDGLGGSCAGSATNGLIVECGNVGIGTTNPSLKLVVAGKAGFDNPTAGDFGAVAVAGKGNGLLYSVVNLMNNDGTEAWGIQHRQDSNNNLAIGYFTTSQYPLQLTTDGKVGIGTTNPMTKLDVAGDIVASGTVCDSNGCIPDRYVSEWQSLSSGGSVTFNHPLGTDALSIDIQVRYGGVIHQQHTSDFAGLGYGVEAYEITSTQVKVSAGAADIRYFTSTGMTFSVPALSSVEVRILLMKMD